ncbi:MAG: bifunctional hydroxymethylpyrimidine kinase/phosphomethylpyrimidine kinase [Opitutaceae bacterium]|jgi:hydroxymethylpyrimidine/phosphomethylpyrimidine kinase|nr:bifunctional hydroxymethylpyrimidine kinase/phosphomethylpyrimidine kinase [Opitutaceae bacterium]
MIPNVLSIAGVDPSGGAGVLADIKTFSALGAYGMGAIAALTAQNTRGVTAVQTVPPDFITAQLETLFADIRVDAVKIGMLADSPTIAAVAASLKKLNRAPVVLDPVMVAKGGHPLLRDDAVATLRRELLPLASVLTPNLPEAAALLGKPPPRNLDEMKTAARQLRALGPSLVVLKGGHLDTADSPDVADDGSSQIVLPAGRVPTRNTHGTGCTFSAAIAALLPRHKSPLDAVRAAKTYLTDALRAADRLSVGSGHGPVHHFHALRAP